MDIRIGHASMQFSDSVAHKEHDAEKLFGEKCRWYTGTEGGDKPLKGILREAAQDHGYTFYVERDSWIAIQRENIARRLGKLRITAGGVKVVDSSRVVGPGHDSGITWNTYMDKDLGRQSILASHMATKGTPVALDPKRRVNVWVNRRIAAEIGRLARAKGAGSNKVWYGGDQNIKDNLADTFFGQPLTSCWDQLGFHPNTGHGNIDVIANYDGDRRARFIGAHAYNDREFFLNTDHYFVAARARIS